MDDLGNRTGTVEQRDTTHTHSYAPQPPMNRYSAVDGQTLAYDFAGNLTSDKQGYHYEYDYENRIVRIENGAGNFVASFDYDALGHRIRKIAGTETTLYYFDPDWRLLAEYAPTNNQQLRKYIYGNGLDETLRMTDTYAGDNTPAGDYYFLQDHLDSPAALLDSAGAVVERYEFDAYGTRHVYDQNFGDRTNTSFGVSIAFQGHIHDRLDNGILNLLDARHRTYDPFTGRWLQHDPLGFFDSMNLYESMLSNPLMDSDPYGLFSRLHDKPAWTIGFSLSRPWSYFYREMRQKRDTYRRQQQIMDEAYRTIEEAMSGRCDKMKQCMQCVEIGQEIVLAVVLGSGQGVANTVNAVQDKVIGYVNLPIQGCNWAMQPITDYQIPTLSTKEWSYRMVLKDEDITLHQLSKRIGGDSVEFLVGVGSAKIVAIVKKGGDASKAKKAAECLKESLEKAGKNADDVADVGNATTNQRKIRNPNGSKGNPDHQQTIDKFPNLAESEMKQGEIGLREQKIQNLPSNRRPDYQILDETGTTRKVFEAERLPNSKRNRLREAEYDQLGIEHETHPLD
jgi:RHS repeat-associated protein